MEVERETDSQLKMNCEGDEWSPRLKTQTAGRSSTPWVMGFTMGYEVHQDQTVVSVDIAFFKKIYWLTPYGHCSGGLAMVSNNLFIVSFSSVTFSLSFSHKLQK